MLLSSAISFVRTRMDEIAFNNDDMILAGQDDRNLDVTIERLLPEAAQVVFLAAPVALLSPEVELEYDMSSQDPQPSYIEQIDLDEPKLEIELNATAAFLRLVYFKADDSDVFVTKTVPFNSPKARQQSNEYVRGTADAPVIVERKTASDHVVLSYYGTESSDFLLGFIKKPAITGSDAARQVFCPQGLEEAVLNQLTGMVLDTYSDQRSQLFYQKANNYLQ